MKLALCLFSLLLSIATSSAQTNCSNPKVINLCPAVHLIGETNAGMIDDVTMPCNLPGEDVLYQINAPNGAGHIYVSILNATGDLECTLEQGSCGSGNCSSQFLGAGSSNINFTVANATQYFLWINAATSITYDISIGGDTGTAIINVPNTKGNLQLDSSVCAVPVFNPSKPFFQVAYNGVYKTLPMTLSPLFVAGTLCVTTYFKNSTGVEGIKQFEFDFNPAGFASVTPQPATFPGFYNAGNWQATQNGTKWKFVFADAANVGRGDFTGLPNTCLRYVFCFTVTPLSNLPSQTNVNVTATSDGFGSPYNAAVNMGCCPVGFLNCLNNSGAGGPVAGAASAFGFGFDDPGGALPIVLTYFDAEVVSNKVLIKWVVNSQTNNDYFTIEKSKDNREWRQLEIIDGAGTVNVPITYQLKDNNPFNNVSYYRLKQTDFNGDFAYSPSVKIFIGEEDRWVVYPNPASEYLYVLANDYSSTYHFYNVSGTEVQLKQTVTGNVVKFDLADLRSGFYFIEWRYKGEGVSRTKVIVRR
ncbi:MAG TPA: T9SS type A sorting domain-containing protein [Bacteroidia bacterium]|nr:T9SS type A sorting domain-containing protein [Bacteroidia bacterium]HNU34633.1 T9SS type A sorting domain-containing protein [Bacteroidia bacterium]